MNNLWPKREWTMGGQPKNWDDDAEAAMTALEARLLEHGGESVMRTGPVSFVKRLVQDGRWFSTDGLTVVNGWPFSCLTNTVPRWINGEGEYVQGYSLLPEHGQWWVSNWILRPDGTILDSVPRLQAYYGIVLNEEEQEKLLRRHVNLYGRRFEGGWGQDQITHLDYLPHYFEGS